MLTTFIAHVSDFASVWLIVLVGFERLILLYRKSRSLTLERARAQTVALLLLAMLFNSWILFVAQVDESGICDIDLKYINLYNTMALLESAVCMALPSIAILICNCLVVYKLHQHLRKNPGSPSVSFNTGDTADIVLTTTNSNSHTLKSYTRASLGRLSSRFSMEIEKKPIKKKGLRYQDIQLTRSLLLVTWFFIILNLPNYIYRIITQVLEITPNDTLINLSLLSHVFLYTHHAFLFYLYIFYSPQMKRRLKPTALKLLECYCCKPAGDISTYIDT
ncbi:hypothetical protein WR25_10547 [Diploscapter pachys]|uniref:G-protein coupled receptors family 1 profile domain-containing protein n=1 Tax=Diploscapter pachys TaxID=2018661 RepID=A0A2A2J321_9BILA|nr:hypothetical protein WR25_10547 [Diploscapter pachys]